MSIEEISETVPLNQVVPFFQPIIDLNTNRVWRYECLARLITPNQQTFLPSEFLQVVARNHHITALTQTMLIQSARYFHGSQTAWNINLDAEDLHNEPLTNLLLTLLADEPNPGRVCVEISAATALSHAEQVRQFIQRSLHCGLGIFIDNVAGHAGELSELCKLPIRGIKISTATLSTLNTISPENLKSLLSDRDILLIAERVETKAELAQVRAAGIRYAQGYVFSPPAPAKH